MAMTAAGAAAKVLAHIDADTDGLYGALAKPDTSADQFEALVHYLCRGVIEEIQANAEIAALDVDLDPTDGTPDGETLSASGKIS
jgi:hypothetical protein